jgi:hypothetical protein
VAYFDDLRPFLAPASVVLVLGHKEHRQHQDD